jgi:hypothetical protein
MYYGNGPLLGRNATIEAFAYPESQGAITSLPSQRIANNASYPARW